MTPATDRIKIRSVTVEPLLSIASIAVHMDSTSSHKPHVVLAPSTPASLSVGSLGGFGLSGGRSPM
jgi:hypothetical protein